MESKDVRSFQLEPLKRLDRDLKRASVDLSDAEARYLVDAYYLMQENRKRTSNQLRSMESEPNSVLSWLDDQGSTLETQIKRALESYTDGQAIGVWMKSNYGIGPVIAAGIIAHINIDKCQTAGQIWRFAGLDPSSKWEKGKKRPWNAELKVLCWKIGQSFMKFSNHEACFYGRIYRERKAYEIARNDTGGNKEYAASVVERYNPKTEAYKHLKDGKIPPQQIDARARRYAVKMFLSHMHLVWWWLVRNELPARPYILTTQHHAHMILPPNTDNVPGLTEALRKQYGSA